LGRVFSTVFENGFFNTFQTNWSSIWLRLSSVSSTLHPLKTNNSLKQVLTFVEGATSVRKTTNKFFFGRGIESRKLNLDSQWDNVVGLPFKFFWGGGRQVEGRGSWFFWFVFLGERGNWQSGTLWGWNQWFGNYLDNGSLIVYWVRISKQISFFSRTSPKCDGNFSFFFLFHDATCTQHYHNLTHKVCWKLNCQ
jgi:hypothetical protein